MPPWRAPSLADGINLLSATKNAFVCIVLGVYKEILVTAHLSECAVAVLGHSPKPRRVWGADPSFGPLDDSRGGSLGYGFEELFKTRAIDVAKAPLKTTPFNDPAFEPILL